MHNGCLSADLNSVPCGRSDGQFDAYIAGAQLDGKVSNQF